VLRSDKEIREILFEMKHSAPLREKFQVEVLPAATMDDFSREIIYSPPYLIHFCGHATERGILLEGGNAEAKVMPTASLIGLLSPFSGQVECVILNACETLYSARELASCIPYVIGMRQEIVDPAALTFSRGFYQALGAGHSMEKSFELGKARLLQDYFTENENPVLFSHGRAM
jgi:hypothetical protein